jgi:hypothetical protein
MPIGAQSQAVAVTVDNFARAETDWAFAGAIQQQGCFGKFYHFREMTPLDKRAVPRMNRDTLYSCAVFDLDAAPETITLPDAGKRFSSMFVVKEDQYVISVVYDPGTYRISREQTGTRYVLVGLRTLVDPANSKDVKQVRALQDAVRVEQQNAGRCGIPN